MKTIIGISRDHSGSMWNIVDAAAEDYNSMIETIADSSNSQEVVVNTVKCGVGDQGRVDVELENTPIRLVKPIPRGGYVADGRRTPLFDSVGELIEMIERHNGQKTSEPDLTFEGTDGKKYTAVQITDMISKHGKAAVASATGRHRDTIRKWEIKINSAPKKEDDDVAFLIMAITDGGNNVERRWNAKKLAEKIAVLNATDRWTFVFRVPRGQKNYLAGLGIPADNILEWELTSSGVREASQRTTQAFGQFFKQRAAGVRHTKTFYPNIAGVSSAEVKRNLVEVTREVEVHDVKGVHTVQSFSQRALGHSLQKGTLFYQLTKREKEVQDYKMICIREKATGKVYGGAAARDMLGLPHSGTVPVAPGDHGKWDVFLQSTSYTRKLPEGTQVLYWPNALVA